MKLHHVNTHEGAAQGGVRWLLRAEGLMLLAISCIGYERLGHGWDWGWFAGLFLLPDVALIGYVAGPRVGALCYNATHSTVLPFILLTLGIFVDIESFEGIELCLPVALIWLAHIGFDRMLGYGLKYTQGFGWTHLGRIGKHRPSAD